MSDIAAAKTEVKLGSANKLALTFFIVATRAMAITASILVPIGTEFWMFCLKAPIKAFDADSDQHDPKNNNNRQQIGHSVAPFDSLRITCMKVGTQFAQ